MHGRFLDKVEIELRTRSGNSILVETSTTTLKKMEKSKDFLQISGISPSTSRLRNSHPGETGSFVSYQVQDRR